MRKLYNFLPHLMILLLRERELFNATSCTSLRLFSLNKTTLLVVELGLKVLDLLLQPGGDLPAPLDRLLLRLVQFCLHVPHLTFQ